MFVIPPYQYSIIIGLILSDGWLIKGSTTSINPRLGLAQSLNHFEYIFFVFNALSHYCQNYPTLRGRERNTKIHYIVEFVTRSLPCFLEIYNLFYPNKVKVIPQNIYVLLTPVALAHLIMGDGFASGKGVSLSTDSFCLEDIVRLMNVLFIRYELKCTLHKVKGCYRIYISRHSIDKLIKLVKPHLVPSMYYKLGITSP